MIKCTPGQEIFCVETRKMGKTYDEILTLFQDVYGVDLDINVLKNIFKEHRITKKKQIVFSKEMEEYIKKEYRSKDDIPRIAEYLNLKKVQVRGKVAALGLNQSREDSRLEIQITEAARHMKKIEAIKRSIKVNESKVKVKYNKPKEIDNDNRFIKPVIVIAPVIGIYPNLVLVSINGIKSAFSYDEILKVL